MDGPAFLIVEDSPTMRQLMTFTLKRIKNAKVVEASNGIEGIQKLAEGSFDLIIVDINMPLMDGLKFLGIIKKEPAHCNIPTVIVTTEGADADRDKGIKLGATAYISKPIQTNEFLKQVKSILKLD